MRPRPVSPLDDEIGCRFRVSQAGEFTDGLDVHSLGLPNRAVALERLALIFQSQ